MTDRTDRVRAAKVAVVATAIAMASYVVIALIFNFSLTNHLTSQVDVRLSQRLALTVKDGGQREASVDAAAAPKPGDLDNDDAPIFVWKVASSGVSTSLVAGAPRLPERKWVAGDGSMRIDGSTFGVRAESYHGGWLVAGESLADVERVRASLINAELIFGAGLLVLIYGASFIVGMRALTPIARAQRRQREFTADASHELRTPLSVIEAEVSIALSKERDATSYRSALERIGGEGHRLQRIVDDLLWLARFDEQRTHQIDETADLEAIAFACTQRFQIVAETSQLRLTFVKFGDEDAIVRAPRDSLDRLVGVLIDNACKFAGEGGRVEVIVATQVNTVTLEVDDSGPGIDPHERDLIFDRFHRTSTSAGGAGLGLAIADSIIRATQAHCTIGTASIGGAKFELTWRLATAKSSSPDPG
ncbi:MAG TPA: HAMP domain-containing sensor histidine kinase [Acidimicrobiales bacterium]|nr:HAMP domain-containing sensor histidine kinase [Acidimicrobiales bacterium]